jgi:hypothetical protein
MPGKKKAKNGARKAKSNNQPKNKQTRSGVADSMAVVRKPQGQMDKSAKLGAVESVCSITDPFCRKARLAKWPDGQGGGSVAYQIRGHQQFVSYANGTNVVYVAGGLPYGLIQAASTVGGYTLQGAYSLVPGSPSFVTYADTFRITSWGIIVRNILPALTASGFVTISKQSDMPPVSAVIPSGEVFGSDVMSAPVSAGMQLSAISKPLGGLSRVFATQNTGTTETRGWEVLKIELQGAPASLTCLDIEFVYNVEFTLAAANIGFHQFAKPDAPHNPTAITAASHVTNNISTLIEGGVEAVGKAVLSQAESTLTTLASKGMGWLAALI